MRLMMIHADRFSFKVTDKTSVAGFSDELSPGENQSQVCEVLVAFLAVEKGDESNAEDISEQTAAQVRATAEKVGAENVMVYPYAHLSSDLAKPRAVEPGNPSRPIRVLQIVRNQLQRAPAF